MTITKQSTNVLVSDERIYADKDGKIVMGGKDGKIPAEAKTVIAEPGQPISPAMAAKYGMTAGAEDTASPVAAGDATTATADRTEPMAGVPAKGPVETKPRGKAKK